MKTCPDCGRQLADSAAACPQCGRRFSTGASITLAILLGLFLGLGGCVFFAR